MFLSQRHRTASTLFIPRPEPGKNNPGTFGSLKSATVNPLCQQENPPARVRPVVPVGEMVWGKPRGVRGAEPREISPGRGQKG